MAKKPVKEVTKHEKQPLGNIERSGYEMSVDKSLRSAYSSHAEYNNSRVRYIVFYHEVVML